MHNFALEICICGITLLYFSSFLILTFQATKRKSTPSAEMHDFVLEICIWGIICSIIFQASTTYWYIVIVIWLIWFVFLIICNEIVCMLVLLNLNGFIKCSILWVASHLNYYNHASSFELCVQFPAYLKKKL